MRALIGMRHDHAGLVDGESMTHEELKEYVTTTRHNMVLSA
jgi:hypothetical protein